MQALHKKSAPNNSNTRKITTAKMKLPIKKISVFVNKFNIQTIKFPIGTTLMEKAFVLNPQVLQSLGGEHNPTPTGSAIQTPNTKLL